MSGVEWWVPGALALCAAAFTAGVAILGVLAVRGVWRLFHPAGAHAAAGPVPWVPWEDDPRFGSMQLDADQAVNRQVDEWVAQSRWLAAPEVAHEGDWRDQTARDLAPATLGSGLGVGPSLAPPSPEWLRGPEQPHEKPAGTESAGSGHLASHRDDDQGRDVRVRADDSRPAARADLTGSLSSRSPIERAGPAGAPLASVTNPEPEPEGRTVAGRLIETSDEWLQRLMGAAGPGWTYAGTVAA